MHVSIAVYYMYVSTMHDQDLTAGVGVEPYNNHIPFALDTD
jgi:hypothetical protein